MSNRHPERAENTNEQKAAYPVYRWRFVTVGVLISAGLIGLMARTAYLQVVNTDFLQAQGAARSVRDIPIAGYRGAIRDRNGVELAVSVETASVFIDPFEIITKHDPEGMRESRAWHQLAALLGLQTRALNQLVEKHSEKRFVWAKRQLDPMVTRLIRELDLPGVHLAKEFRRTYPTGEVNAHIVGFTNIDDQGIEGIERAFNERLAGKAGRERQVLDRRRRVVESQGVIEAADPGQDLTLSIDTRLQAIAYQELKNAVVKNRARGGSAVLLDVRTGEVLAMVNQPSFNPNKRADRGPGKTRNRAITDTFEPGSTVKPITMISALESGQFDNDMKIDTNPGQIRVGGSWVRDIHNYGVLDLVGVIRKSSNIGVTYLALALPKDYFLNTFASFGFGQPTHVGFPGESAGNFRIGKRWSKFELATLSFGYAMTVTPLQLAHAYTVLASGGIKRPVTLLKVDRGVIGERIVKEENARRVVQMMHEATLEGGTGKRARVEGYCIAGKTGTARKAIAGGYSSEYIVTFAGIAPCNDPRLVMVVTIDEPGGELYSGGEVSAPVFSSVMSQALRLMNIPPDAPNGEKVAGQSARRQNDA